MARLGCFFWDIKILDLEIGIIVRSKIADYKITKFMIDLAMKNIGWTFN